MVCYNTPVIICVRRIAGFTRVIAMRLSGSSSASLKLETDILCYNVKFNAKRVKWGHAEHLKWLCLGYAQAPWTIDQ